MKLHFNNEQHSDDHVLRAYPSMLRRRVLRHLYLDEMRSAELFMGVRQRFMDALLSGARRAGRGEGGGQMAPQRPRRPARVQRTTAPTPTRPPPNALMQPLEWSFTCLTWRFCQRATTCPSCMC